jgi:hypothetical protein
MPGDFAHAAPVGLKLVCRRARGGRLNVAWQPQPSCRWNTCGAATTPDMEYVDGQLVERHVGEWRHSRFRHLISVELSPRELDRFLMFTEQRVQVKRCSFSASTTGLRFRTPGPRPVAVRWRARDILCDVNVHSVDYLHNGDQGGGWRRQREETAQLAATQ